MLKGNIKNDRKGIGGFFFDIPVLLLIIVVITVFTTSLYQVYVPIEEERERISQDRTCLDLKNDVQNFQKILAEGNEGFSIEKLDDLEEENLESYLKSGSGYEYNISFNILETEDSWSFGSSISSEEGSSEIDISSYQIPVSLIGEGGISHLGKLKVDVWKD